MNLGRPQNEAEFHYYYYYYYLKRIQTQVYGALKPLQHGVTLLRS